MSKLTEKQITVKIYETTKIGAILYHIFCVMSIIIPFLCYFLKTSEYIFIGFAFCMLAVFVHDWNMQMTKLTSNSVDFESITQIINTLYKEKNN